MALVHSFGATCSLHEQFNDFTRRASGISPKIRAHFFYSSALPIDDPLSPLPTPSTTYQSGHSKVQPRPFSAYDNAALEKAWQGVYGPECKGRRSKVHHHGPFCNDTGIVLRSHELHSTKYVHSSSKQEDTNKAIQLGNELYCSDTEGQDSQGNPSVEIAKKHGHGPYCSDTKNRDRQDNHLVSVIKDVKETAKSKEWNSPKGKEKGSSQKTKSKLSAVTTPSEDLPIGDVQRGAMRITSSDGPEGQSLRRGGSNTAIVHGESPKMLCDDPQHNEGLLYERSDSNSAVLHGGSTKKHTNGDTHVLLCDDPQHIPFGESMPITNEELDVSEHEDADQGKRHRSIFHRRSSQKKQKAEKSPKPSRSPSRHKVKAADTTYGSSPSERQTTGTPFLRAPSPNRQNVLSQHDGAGAASDDEGQMLTPKKPARRFHSDNSDSHSHKSEAESATNLKHHTSHCGFTTDRKEDKAYVPVGLSRLHLVEMPVLEASTRDCMIRPC